MDLRAARGRPGVSAFPCYSLLSRDFAADFPDPPCHSETSVQGSHSGPTRRNRAGGERAKERLTEGTGATLG